MLCRNKPSHVVPGNPVAIARALTPLCDATLPEVSIGGEIPRKRRPTGELDLLEKIVHSVLELCHGLPNQVVGRRKVLVLN